MEIPTKRTLETNTILKSFRHITLKLPNIRSKIVDLLQPSFLNFLNDLGFSSITYAGIKTMVKIQAMATPAATKTPKTWTGGYSQEGKRKKAGDRRRDKPWGKEFVKNKDNGFSPCP